MVEHESYWIASTPPTAYPPAPKVTEVDVAVIGAGIAGVTTAVRLKRDGLTVALVEAGRIVEGITGHTTAKVAVSHGLLYAYLVERHGEDKALLYAASQRAALDHIAETVATENVDCDFVRTPSYVYTEDPGETDQLRNEAETAAALGLPAQFSSDVPLPYDVAGAVRYDQQARFHPRKYLLHLARGIDGDGSVVLERTRALDVDEGDPCTVTTDHGVVRARHVVVATHIPFLDRGLFFAREFPVFDYVIAARIDRARAPDGMFLSTEQPTHSVRVTEDGDGMLLIVGGEGHPTGRAGGDDDRSGYDRLAAWAGDRFGVTDVRYRWSAQDYTTADRVPYVGLVNPASKRVWVATGFGAWGMTNGTMAGLLLADLVQGRPNPWAAVYDPQRVRTTGTTVRRAASANLSVVKELVKGYVTTSPVADAGELANGQAAVVRDGLGKTAAYRDEDGTLHAVSARCTHLGCVVGWNAADRTWDCPCHGSRFDVDGGVLHGPAVRPLDQRTPVSRQA